MTSAGKLPFAQIQVVQNLKGHTLSITSWLKSKVTLPPYYIFSFQEPLPLLLSLSYAFCFNEAFGNFNLYFNFFLKASAMLGLGRRSSVGKSPDL